jgi:hypothetical protein
LDGALKLDYDRVVPGHGPMATKSDVAKYRQTSLTLRNRVHEMVVAKRTRADIEKMLRGEFHFADLHVARSLDGLIAELQ